MQKKRLKGSYRFRITSGELGALLLFASTDDTRPNINCICVANGYLFSSDGYRLLACANRGATAGVVIPRGFADEVHRLTKKNSVVQFDISASLACSAQVCGHVLRCKLDRSVEPPGIGKLLNEANKRITNRPREIGIDSRYLASIERAGKLLGCTSVLLSFGRGKFDPVIAKFGTHWIALIMPMNLDGEKKRRKP